MATAQPPFPYRNLPFLNRIMVLQHMELSELITFSLCSKVSKMYVKSLKRSIGEVEFKLYNQIALVTGRWNYEVIRFEFEDSTRFLESNCTVTSVIQDNDGYEDDEVQNSWNIPELRIKQWLDHLFDIFALENISLHLFDACQVHGVDSIQRLVQGYPMESFEIIGDEFEETFLREMLDTFLPVRKFHSNQNIFQDTVVFRNFLSHEFFELSLQDNIPVTLRDLLITKCTGGRFWGAELSENDMNVFLRVWMDGWNSKLKYLDLQFRRRRWHDDYIDRIFDGIEHEVVEEKRKWIVPTTGGYIKFKGGYDILRCDGTKASVYFRHRNDDIDVKFMVWP